GRFPRLRRIQLRDGHHLLRRRRPHLELPGTIIARSVRFSVRPRGVAGADFRVGPPRSNPCTGHNIFSSSRLGRCSGHLLRWAPLRDLQRSVESKFPFLRIKTFRSIHHNTRVIIDPCEPLGRPPNTLVPIHAAVVGPAFRSGPFGRRVASRPSVLPTGRSTFLFIEPCLHAKPQTFGAPVNLHPPHRPKSLAVVGADFRVGPSFL